MTTMRWLVLSLSVFASCTCTPMVGSPCKADCDCAGGITNVKCPGNFFCRNGACAYDCATTCSPDAGASACPAGLECSGEFCRKLCEG